MYLSWLSCTLRMFVLRVTSRLAILISFLTEPRFEPETSGLTYQGSTTWAIQPLGGGLPNVNYLCWGWGCQAEAIQPLTAVYLRDTNNYTKYSISLKNVCVPFWKIIPCGHVGSHYILVRSVRSTWGGLRGRSPHTHTPTHLGRWVCGQEFAYTCMYFCFFRSWNC